MDASLCNISDDIASNSSLVETIVQWTTFSIGFPLICLSIYAMYFLIRADHIAPVYVINLLIADLIQICMRPIILSVSWKFIATMIEFFGISASVGFMVCVALERYLVIAFPLWYRFRRNIKYSLIVSSFIWVVPFIQIYMFHLTPTSEISLILFAVSLLIPFPLLVFFLVGTLKALSVSISVPAVEQRRIIGTLALVLGNYTVLFLPLIIQYLISAVTCQKDVMIGTIFESFSPLVDPLLYVFMRKGAKDTLAFPCFDKLMGDQEQSQVTNTMTITDSGVEGSR
ncbi:G-protein coupled receptor 4-like [Salmo trutta]|uniref:G-protein coupled receptor 4 n=1 Tax=Salmo trutta TaxID=8032 RepID=UPI0011317963|nr:G-protein coupled receptor 4-like [Salmo trutta]XP_029621037.1 G-protein coupled receptor 4-like [Salmo trutta]XP_029621038.1 G-protein coupled receptor 4-like [Salmo trutta]XP_029621039.1 G-protein coupled receptor 4-like [Salmo trutta]XP_029621043.1 G-protein coupled receptor 4-like [Salmo trutta]XP_029621045.1 G-protein coupled receptor 4-like [Salmo trutta]XP_029621046.1 G-protein coupled receptor 4-like [Salmo trutta]